MWNREKESELEKEKAYIIIIIEIVGILHLLYECVINIQRIDVHFAVYHKYKVYENK